MMSEFIAELLLGDEVWLEVGHRGHDLEGSTLSLVAPFFLSASW